jgi:hypothetical protein
MDDRHELLERYKIAHAEYRAEVAIGWDRQKLCLTLSAALTGAVAVAATRPLAARLTLVAAALIAIAGVLLGVRSHARYRATREQLRAIEDALGISDVQTTGGQREARGAARFERFRVVDVLAMVFVLIAAIDVALAALW